MKKNPLPPLAGALFAVMILFASCRGQEKSVSPDFINNMKLVWADEFDGK